MKRIISISFLFFWIACGGGDNILSEEELKNNAYGNKTTIRLSMSDDLELTLKASNFTESVSILSFEVVYNANVIKLSSYSSGTFGTPWSNIESMDVNNDTTHASFNFTNSISGDGELLKLKFQGSESAFQGTTIFLRYLSFYDNNGTEISFDEGFHSEDICYISRQCENCDGQSGEVLFAGEYNWSNTFCRPLNYNPTP